MAKSEIAPDSPVAGSSDALTENTCLLETPETFSTSTADDCCALDSADPLVNSVKVPVGAEPIPSAGLATTTVTLKVAPDFTLDAVSIVTIGTAP